MGTTIPIKKAGWLLGFLGLTAGAAALGGAFTAPAVNTWYRTLRKPTWNPPNWLFGPVWTLLYAMMAVSAWLVYREMPTAGPGRGEGRLALAAWMAQLALNISWSAAFFGRRRIGAAVAIISALWSAILTTVLLSARVAKPAALLLLPYLAWTTFAGFLNYRVWQMNRD